MMSLIGFTVFQGAADILKHGDGTFVRLPEGCPVSEVASTRRECVSDWQLYLDRERSRTCHPVCRTEVRREELKKKYVGVCVI